jgi:short chain dehydrogenase
MSQMILPRMVANKKGFIINLSSAAGLSCLPFASVYAATKVTGHMSRDLRISMAVKSNLSRRSGLATLFSALLKDLLKVLVLCAAEVRHLGYRAVVRHRSGYCMVVVKKSAEVLTVDGWSKYAMRELTYI